MTDDRRRSTDLMVDDLRVRVTDVEKTFQEVKSLISMREQRDNDMHTKVDLIYTAIVGNIEHGEPGLMTKVDRLEQSEEKKKWLYAGVFGLILNAAWEWVKR